MPTTLEFAGWSEFLCLPVPKLNLEVTFITAKGCHVENQDLRFTDKFRAI